MNHEQIKESIKHQESLKRKLAYQLKKQEKAKNNHEKTTKH